MRSFTYASGPDKMKFGGDGGIRTLDRALQPYNGLANRRLQPLGHISASLGKRGRDICPTPCVLASACQAGLGFRHRRERKGGRIGARAGLRLASTWRRAIPLTSIAPAIRADSGR